MKADVLVVFFQEVEDDSGYPAEQVAQRGDGFGVVSVFFNHGLHFAFFNKEKGGKTFFRGLVPLLFVFRLLLRVLPRRPVLRR